MPPTHTAPLASLTSLGVGGPARLIAADTEQQLREALAQCREERVAAHILGGGSNVVVADRGPDGLVIRVGLRGRAVADLDDGWAAVVAAAGEPWDDLVRWTVQRDLAGIECLSGIPGLTGATPIQNVGAYGQEVAQVIERVRVMDRQTLTVSDMPRAACAFAYRDSVFKHRARHRYVVLEVEFRLRKSGEPLVAYPELQRFMRDRSPGAPTLQGVRDAVLTLRRQKSMAHDQQDENSRSCGSFFVNPVVTRAELEDVESRCLGAGLPAPPRYPQPDGRAKLPAAWLIERAGFERGLRDGPVGLSTRHTLAIVAHQGASAAQITAFARRVRLGVHERFGIQLIPEPNFWGFEKLCNGLPVD